MPRYVSTSLKHEECLEREALASETLTDQQLPGRASHEEPGVQRSANSGLSAGKQHGHPAPAHK